MRNVYKKNLSLKINRKIDINSLTPVEALLKLSELKKKLDI